MDHLYSINKRAFDLFFSILLLLLFSPILITVSVILKLQGNGIFFKQLRIGKNYNEFYMVKFKTMKDINNKNGKPLPDAKRITKIGHFLRKTSVDELPELINIIKGDMSFVGPRPLLKKYLPYYSKTELLRYTVPQGLTGLAQINGRNTLTWDNKLEFDVKYVQQASFWVDMKILIKTAHVVLFCKGVSTDSSTTEPALDELRKKGP